MFPWLCACDCSHWEQSRGAGLRPVAGSVREAGSRRWRWRRLASRDAVSGQQGWAVGWALLRYRRRVLRGNACVCRCYLGSGRRKGKEVRQSCGRVIVIRINLLCAHLSNTATESNHGEGGARTTGVSSKAETEGGPAGRTSITIIHGCSFFVVGAGCRLWSVVGCR